MSKHELLLESLEALVDAEEFNDGVYRRFFDGNGEAQSLMAHMDDQTRGRMLEEVTRLVMTEDIEAEDGYLRFEVDNHKFAYSVTAGMYRELFEAFLAEVKSLSSSRWSSDYEMAWLAHIDTLVARLEELAS